jgi:hypothetical protein
MKTKVLTLLVNQFIDRNKKLPEEIVIHPIALAALAIKQSVAPLWNGIPVKCREIKPEATASPTKLGITVVNGALRGFDL